MPEWFDGVDLLPQAYGVLVERTATPAHEGCLMGYEYQGQPSAGFSVTAGQALRTRDLHTWSLAPATRQQQSYSVANKQTAHRGGFFISRS